MNILNSELFYSQTLITQLNWLYKISEVFVDSEGKYSNMEMCAADVNKPYFYDLIYDQLTKEGHLTADTFTPEQKNKMWQLAQVCFVRNEKRQPKETDKDLLHKYYKSYLAKRYVLSRLPERMWVQNADTGEYIVEKRFVIGGGVLAPQK